ARWLSDIGFLSLGLFLLKCHPHLITIDQSCGHGKVRSQFGVRDNANLKVIGIIRVMLSENLIQELVGWWHDLVVFGNADRPSTPLKAAGQWMQERFELYCQVLFDE